MRSLAVLLPMLIAILLLSAAAQAQDDSPKPQGETGRPKLTQDDITDLKLAHYEVERTEVKFQPYIITYEGEELNQLEYDTRKEAQARVDEINNWDRLDKLGVEGKQNKKVGIREVKRTSTEWISGDSVGRIAKKRGRHEDSRGGMSWGGRSGYGGVFNRLAGYLQGEVAFSRPESVIMWPIRRRTPFLLVWLFIPQTPGGTRPVEPPEKHVSDDDGKDRLELGKTIWVCRIQQPGEVPQDVLTLLPPKVTFTKGIIPEAIVGVLKRPLKEGEAITSETFVRNKAFTDFMHEFIALHGTELEGLQAEARKQGEGWVYLIDARTANPPGKVPPHDIIGAFEVKAGRLVPQSYKRNPNHVLLSRDGFFRLPSELQDGLLRELTTRSSRPKEGGDEDQGK